MNARGCHPPNHKEMGCRPHLPMSVNNSFYIGSLNLRYLLNICHMFNFSVLQKPDFCLFEELREGKPFSVLVENNLRYMVIINELMGMDDYHCFHK